MLKIVDLVYDSYEQETDPLELIRRQDNTLSFIPFISGHAEYNVIRHMDYEGRFEWKTAKYGFFKRKNSSWRIPFRTHNYIRRIRPDIILVQGLIFPLQSIFLKLVNGKNSRLIMQHHGETPVASKRKFLQKIADRFVDSYLFSSFDNALPWLKAGVISSPRKIKVIPAASIDMQRMNKQDSRKELGIPAGKIFLWVGRLEQNKDPFTVLKAFKDHLDDHPDSKLYMIYQDQPLLKEIRDFIHKHNLNKSIVLVGKIDHEALSKWYSAADFYLSASRSEACGYAIIEAMHCGCIPIVTNIPSFNEITQSGKYGQLYQTENSQELHILLNNLSTRDNYFLSESIADYARNNLSPRNMANKLLCICNDIMAV